ncbi:DUF3106 domain-containing protein [Xanthomonas albilineans]|uniref:Hypothetical secreted protein n=1 Tax=Xanthomonas albilineans (strain GPE PC73 / CFBP 7063) TaxID=380358 RepID=D2UBT8_XANAP|nr:DUF3106 domain-containing protein [Xanthomonas albilineans]QHQ27207.1 putative secreted protein [Xanthomonas albilineans]CBA15003.1 hypothetical secreted protein [Xanthomonas albilineans GPE PC73]
MNRPIRFSLALTLLASHVIPAVCATPPTPPAPAVVDAQSGSPLPDWEHLSPQQRELLIAPLRQRWNDAPSQRQRMFEHAQRWQSMTPEQRAHAREGARRYEAMTPQQREEAQAVFAYMRTLPPEQRKTLRDRLDAMTPAQRTAWIKANLGASAPMPDPARPLP